MKRYQALTWIQIQIRGYSHVRTFVFHQFPMCLCSWYTSVHVLLALELG